MKTWGAAWSLSWPGATSATGSSSTNYWKIPTTTSTSKNETHPAALGQSTSFCWCFFRSSTCKFFLPGSREAAESAHQPVELPRKHLTKPWDWPNGALCNVPRSKSILPTFLSETSSRNWGMIWSAPPSSQGRTRENRRGVKTASKYKRATRKGRRKWQTAIRKWGLLRSDSNSKR